MKRYFFNFGFDFFFLSGISILVWILTYVLAAGERTYYTYAIALVVSGLVNWPHFAATSYRLYYRKDFWQQFPLTSVLIPVLVIIATIFSLQNPNSFAIIWVKLYFIWSPYHFSGQTLGLSLLYSRRAGIEITPIQRFFLSAFIYCTFIVMTANAEVGVGDHTYYGVKYPRLNLPGQFIDWLWIWMKITTVGLIMSFYPHWKNIRSFPTLVLILPATQAFWFLFGPQWPGFNEFVPALHSLQYLFIAWMLQLASSHQSATEEKRPFHFLTESTKWYALVCIGGLILFQALPMWGEKAGLPSMFAWGVIIASVQIHHFFVDGVIWKLKDSKIRNPLSAHFSDWKLT